MPESAQAQHSAVTSTPWAQALQAASRIAGGQDTPAATLYMVATPIGNLADFSLRALHTLQMADVLACEDTRHTRQALRELGLDLPQSRLMAAHQHNENEAAAAVVEHLRQGHRVAFVSDAGTPAVSDPGARLARAAQAAGFRVVPLPGASSVTALLSAAGALIETGAQANDGARSGFVFWGFLPAASAARAAAVAQLAEEHRAVALLESPHRIEEAARALASLGSRELTVGRELTKRFEQIVTLRADGLPAWLADNPDHRRGEFALLLHPVARAANTGELAPATLKTLELLMAELPLKTAARLTAEISGASKNALYAAGLSLKSGQPQA